MIAYMSTEARLNMRYTEKKVMKYYDDGGPGRGNCTWGIGTKAHTGPCSSKELARAVTEPDIEAEFSARLKVAEKGGEKHVKVELTQQQFDALVSLTYNAGVNGSNHIYTLLNAGDFGGAANAIAKMTYGHEKRNGKRVRVFYHGLVPRREAESAPFRIAPNAPIRSAAK